MTNYDRWLLYNEGLSSPLNYIQWGFRYLIGASLQRRVWIGGESPDAQSCFPNTYTILVGNPGVGKGLVIREVSNFLKHWKIKDSIKINGNTRPEDKAQIELVVASDIKNAQDAELQVKNKRQDIIDPLLIPVAADATTYEALVEAVAQSYRRINYLKLDDTTGKQVLKIYGHSSICFSLQELGSLLRKRTDDTVNYMLGLYDCPSDYEYNTKTQGKDRVRRGCLNLLAGTTPSFMQSIFSEKLIDEGFGSRSFFIYAQKNRKSQFFIPPHTAEQLAQRTILLEHIRQLTTLYGPIRIDTDSVKFLEDWWEKYSADYMKRANKSPKMLPYYARKNIHTMKVAIANHFGESLEMFVSKQEFEKAISDLEEEEKNMHLAMTIEGSNPLAKISRKILELLSTGRKDYVELMVEMNDYANKTQLEESLSFLAETNQVKMDRERDKDTEQSVQYWSKI